MSERQARLGAIDLVRGAAIVPLFFNVTHIFVVHAVAVLIAFAQSGK